MDIERCYEILEIKPNATIKELKQAYRELVSVWHPDRFPNNPQLQEKATCKLKEINVAYESAYRFLSSEISKEKKDFRQPYDQYKTKSKETNKSYSDSHCNAFSKKAERQYKTRIKAEEYFDKYGIGLFRFSPPYIFPYECFVCGGNAEKQYKLNRIYNFRYYIIGYSWRNFTLRLPICKKHYWQLFLIKLSLAILFLAIITDLALLPEIFIEASQFLFTFHRVIAAILLFVLLIWLGLKSFSLLSNFKIYKFETRGEQIIDLIFSTKRKDLFMKICELDGFELILNHKPEKEWWKSQKGGSF